MIFAYFCGAPSLKMRFPLDCCSFYTKAWELRAQKIDPVKHHGASVLTCLAYSGRKRFCAQLARKPIILVEALDLNA